MSRLPDNFSQAAFDAHYAPDPSPLGHDAERIGQLETILDKLRELADLLAGNDFLTDLADHVSDCIRDVPAMIARIRDAARYDRAA